MAKCSIFSRWLILLSAITCALGLTVMFFRQGDAKRVTIARTYGVNNYVQNESPRMTVMSQPLEAALHGKNVAPQASAETQVCTKRCPSRQVSHRRWIS